MKTLFKAGLIAALTAVGACAAAITVTESIVTSGSLDGNSFTNQLVTVNFSGDTSFRTSPFAGAFQLIGVGGVNVATVGADAFTDATVAFVNQNGGFGGILDNASGLVIIDNLNPGFATYALNTSIGPLSGTSSGNSGTAFATTRGTLVLNGSFGASQPSTFAATVTTPEPGTVGFLVAGFGLLMFRRMAAARRTKSSSPAQ